MLVSALKRIVTLRSITVPAAAAARCVVPPKPVTEQNSE